MRLVYHHLHQSIISPFFYNSQEGIKCFQRAVDVSDLCIFGHWGISLCHGPNYNTKAMSRDSFPSAKDAYKHAQRVSELLQGRATTVKCKEDSILLLRFRLHIIDFTFSCDFLFSMSSSL